MAQSRWGYTRIRRALHNLGHDVARNTIKNTLLANGIDPAPERGKGTTWWTLIQSHLGAIAGANFLIVEVLTAFGLVRYFVFFVIDIGSRRVHIAGITNQPSEVWMKQSARNLTDCVDGDPSHDSNKTPTVDGALDACRDVDHGRGRFERLDPRARSQQELFDDSGARPNRRKSSPWAADIDGYSVGAGVHLGALDRAPDA